MANAPHRISELDILRGCAIFLVMWHHAAFFLSDAVFALPVGLLRRIVVYTFYNGVQMGWVGVDLFFVLSGFLVSGLLFREWLKFGRIGYVRFVIRRGFKIYPGFYVLLAYALLLAVASGKTVPVANLLSDVFYLQNYLPSFIWGHTWTLAVEEHFYLGLPICLVCLVALRKRDADPFRSLPYVFLAVAGIVLGLRVLAAAEGHPAFARTHLQLDSLAFGVLLSYLYHFQPDRLGMILGRRPGLQVLVSVLAVIVFGTIRMASADAGYVIAIGHTFAFLACGTIMMQFLYWNGRFKDTVLRRLAGIGRLGVYSYSVYLWHIPVRGGTHLMMNALGLDVVSRAILGTVVYMAGSVLIGVMLTEIVELPMLRLRDRLFPSRSSDLGSLKGVEGRK